MLPCVRETKCHRFVRTYGLWPTGGGMVKIFKGGVIIPVTPPLYPPLPRQAFIQFHHQNPLCYITLKVTHSGSNKYFVKYIF